MVCNTSLNSSTQTQCSRCERLCRNK